MPYRRAHLLLCLLGAWAPAAAVAQTATISGTVTSAATGAALTGGTVMVCPPAPGACAAAVVDGAGNYTQSVPAGAYVVFTTGFLLQGFVNEVAGGVECAAECSPEAALAAGAPIDVPAGSARSGLDFALTAGATIRGMALDPFTGAPIADAEVSVIGIVPGDVAWWSAVTGADGAYAISGLAAGSYAAYIDPFATGHEGQVYPGVPCVTRCADAAWTGGQRLELTRGQTVNDINFTPAPGGAVAGTVVAAADLAPLANVRVDLYARVGDTLQQARTTFTDAAGAYRVAGLTTGTYYLTTVTSGGINEVYGGGRCVGQCTLDDIARGAPQDITTAAVAPGRVFELLEGATVSGVVTDAATTAPLHATVTLYAIDGGALREAGRTLSNGAGVYTMRGLPEGRDYLAVVSARGYDAELHTGAHCLDCTREVFTGAPLRLDRGDGPTALHVALDPAVPRAVTGPRRPAAPASRPAAGPRSPRRPARAVRAGR